jgi:hypothetical protein
VVSGELISSAADTQWAEREGCKFLTADDRLDPGPTADERRVVAFAQLLVLLVFVVRGVEIPRLDIDDRIRRKRSLRLPQ